MKVLISIDELNTLVTGWLNEQGLTNSNIAISYDSNGATVEVGSNKTKPKKVKKEVVEEPIIEEPIVEVSTDDDSLFD